MPGTRPLFSRLTALALATLVLAAPPAPAQQEAPGVFGEVIDVRVVNIEVVVTDKDNVRVPNLTAQDFRLRVNGKEVPIEYFTEVRGGEAIDTGGDASDVPAVVPGSPVGTSYLVFVDDFFSIARDRNRVIDGLEVDLPGLGPQDRIAVVAYDGRKLEMLSSWSQSVPQLQRALRAAKERPAYGLQRLSEKQQHDREMRMRRQSGMFAGSFTGRLDPLEYEYAEQLAEQVESSVMAASATLRSFAQPPGRKVMLLLSGGWPYMPTEYTIDERARLIMEETIPGGTDLFRPLADTANLLGYTLYPVDVPGLSAAVTDASLSATDEPIRSARTAIDREQEVQTSLTFLARETGGQALLNAGRANALERAAGDTRSYYWLGFTPERQRDDNRYDVEVDVLRPGLRARFRQGFQDYSRTREVTMTVESALLFGNPPSARPLPAQFGRPTRAGMSTVKLPITLRIPANAVTLVPVGGEHRAELELRVAALDDKGRTSEIPVVPITVSTKELPRPDQYFTYQTSLELRKQRHQLVVAIYDRASGTLLSTTAEVTP
jgi:VWFA-related protein